MGLPPVVANTSNTIGIAPAGLSGSFGYRRELRAHPGVAFAVVLTSATGSVLGAFLLLALPSRVFAAVAPRLILFTCLLVGVQPAISRSLRRHTGRRTAMSPLTMAFAVLTGVYGGYFGAGSGVMMVAVLGFGLDLCRHLPPTLLRVLIVLAGTTAALLMLT